MRCNRLKKGFSEVSPFILPSKVSPIPCAGSAGLGCYVLVTKNWGMKRVKRG